MKKLLLMAFAIFTVSAFAVEENKETTQNQIEKNVKIESQQVIQKTEMSLGESFMEAFGMSEGGHQQGGNESIGITSSAANTATVNATNSTTIVTPYGKY